MTETASLSQCKYHVSFLWMKAGFSTKCFMLNKDDNKNLSTGSAS